MSDDLRDDRYPFVVRNIENAFDQSKTIAFGAENGHVICSAPPWWKSDGTEIQEDAIGYAYWLAVQLARKQRGE